MQEKVYKQEGRHLRSEQRRRQLTGSNWARRVDGATGYPFWYNTDTGESQWEKPKVLLKQDGVDKAREAGFAGLPTEVRMDKSLTSQRVGRGGDS